MSGPPYKGPYDPDRIRERVEAASRPVSDPVTPLTAEDTSLARSALGEAIRTAAMLRTETVTIAAPLARFLAATLDAALAHPSDPVTPLTADHWPTLVFTDGDGDLVRCSCGEQGFDFKQGREWFAKHIAALAHPSDAAGEGLTEWPTEVPIASAAHPQHYREGWHAAILAARATRDETALDVLPRFDVGQVVGDLQPGRRRHDWCSVHGDIGPSESIDGHARRAHGAGSEAIRKARKTVKKVLAARLSEPTDG